MNSLEEEPSSDGEQQDVDDDNEQMETDLTEDAVEVKYEDEDPVEVESKDEDIIIPVHPYKYELSQFKPNSWQLEKKEPQNYSSLEDSKFTMVDSLSLLEEMMLKLKEVKELAIDLENHNFRSFLGIVCLVQISTRTEDFVIDSQILKDELKVLNEVCTDSNILKVLHGSERDIEWLQKGFGVYVINMFDTQKAARVLEEEFVSLPHILKKYCKVDVKKEYQRADWRIRPLPDDMVKYAREDSHYLLYIHDIYRNSLLKKGKAKLLDLYRACTVACGEMWHPEKQACLPDSYLGCYKRIKGKLNIQQLECFRLLFEWRHKISKERDESTGYTLPNKMMIKISKALPNYPQEFATCCEPVPRLVQENLEEVQKLVLQAIKNVPEVPEDSYVKKESSKRRREMEKERRKRKNKEIQKAHGCMACGRLGHHAKECVDPSRAGLKPLMRGEARNRGRVAQECMACGRLGHQAKDCVNPRVGNRVECMACGRVGHQANECVNSSFGNSVGLKPPIRGGAWNRGRVAPYGAYPPGGPGTRGMRGGPGFQNYHGRGPRHMGPPRMHPYAHPPHRHPLGGNMYHDMDSYNIGAIPFINPYSQRGARPRPRGVVLYYY